jgi:hypothetical protein
MDTLAKQVAELIYAEAQSGSASWDELHGPSARLTQIHVHKFVIRLPGYDEETDDYSWSKNSTTITVES